MIQTTPYERFKLKNKIMKKVDASTNTRFIFQGNSATKIKKLELEDGEEETCLSAAVVNQQEKDKAYVYTVKTDDLSVGSVWQTKDLKLLITEKITLIKNTDWNKYTALICNVELNGLYGYFKGPEENYINISLEQKSVIVSQQKPVLVLSSRTKFKFGDKLMIKGRGWVIQEFDAISTDGVVYYSLAPATISKDAIENAEDGDNFTKERDETNIQTQDAYEEDNIRYINTNEVITLPTESGFFKSSNTTVKLVQLKANEVKFSLPFGVNDVVTITVKVDGQEQVYYYKRMAM